MAFHQRRVERAKPGNSCWVIAAALAAALSGCAQNRADVTGAISPNVKMSAADWKQRADSLAERYRANPSDPGVAIAYAQALRATNQYSQAAAVLQQASIRNPRH